MKTLLHRLLILVASSALSIPGFAAERPGLHGRGSGSSPYAVYQGAPATVGRQIFELSAAFDRSTAAVPACSVPPATSTGNTWYVDPVNGKTPPAWVTYFAANPGDTGHQGDSTHPWDNLNGILSGWWGTANVTPNVTYPGYVRPLLSSVPYLHTTTTGEAGLTPGEPIGRVFVADNVGNPPVHPGDTIMLMSGNYGSIQIGATRLSTVNSDWVYVDAAPGQTPVISTLFAVSTNKWVFNGITVQSVRTAPAPNVALVTIKDQGPSLPSSDIIFENMNLSSAPNATVLGWTQANWAALARTGFAILGSAGNGTNGEPYTTCVSITGSHVFNAFQGTILQGNSILFTGNEIDHVVEDMLDYVGSNLEITKNFLHDEEADGDGIHSDGMQGQAGPLATGVKYNAYSNVLIDSNTVIRRLDPNLAFPSLDGLQGIDAFDADWTNITVTNNVVITRACWGIAMASTHNGLIANNTVLDDGDTSVVEPGCGPVFSVGVASHEGPPSTNTRATNNLADHFSIDDEYPANNITFDHNVALNSYHSFGQWVKGVGVYGVAPGPDANSNITPATSIPYASVFNTWLPGTWQYNVTLLPGSTVAIGAGTSGAPLPTIDITGATRTSPHTVGAYGYPNCLVICGACRSASGRAATTCGSDRSRGRF